MTLQKKTAVATSPQLSCYRALCKGVYGTASQRSKPRHSTPSHPNTPCSSRVIVSPYAYQVLVPKKAPDMRYKYLPSHQQGMSRPTARATHNFRASPCQSYGKQLVSGINQCLPPKTSTSVAASSFYFEIAYFCAKSLSEGMTIFKVCMSCIIAMCAFSFTNSSGTFLRQPSHPHRTQIANIR